MEPIRILPEPMHLHNGAICMASAVLFSLFLFFYCLFEVGLQNLGTQTRTWIYTRSFDSSKLRCENSIYSHRRGLVVSDNGWYGGSIPSDNSEL